MKPKKLKPEPDWIEYNGEGDAGISLKFRCSVCKEEVTVAQYPWWRSKCGCGLTWDMDIGEAIYIKE